MTKQYFGDKPLSRKKATLCKQEYWDKFKPFIFMFIFDVVVVVVHSRTNLICLTHIFSISLFSWRTYRRKDEKSKKVIENIRRVLENASFCYKITNIWNITWHLSSFCYRKNIWNRTWHLPSFCYKNANIWNRTWHLQSFCYKNTNIWNRTWHLQSFCYKKPPIYLKQNMALRYWLANFSAGTNEVQTKCIKLSS